MVTIPDGITDVKLAQWRAAIVVWWHAAVGEDAAIDTPPVEGEMSRLPWLVRNLLDVVEERVAGKSRSG
jgi:hypothetical protein